MMMAAIVWLAMAAGPALAQWRVQVGIDISSGTSSILLIGTLDERTSFYAQCVGGVKRLFIEAFDGKDEPLLLSGLVDVGVTVDQVNSSLWWTRGQQSRRPGYLVTDLEDAGVHERALADIMAAKTDITFSIYTPVVRTMQDWRVSAQGSTAAGREFLALCAGQLPLPPQQPQEPAPQQPAPQLSPLPQQEPAPQLPSLDPPGESAWSFVDGIQPELIGPAKDGLQLILACVADGVAIVFIESTDITNFPTLRSSRDGLAIFAIDDGEPVVVPVGPGTARRGVLTAVGDDPAGGDAISLMLATAMGEALVLLVADIERDTNVVAEHSLAGAAAAATAFRSSCYGP